MISPTFVLIVVSHVVGGSPTTMHDFDGKAACEFAAKAVREMSNDVSGYPNKTWCVPKYKPE